MLEKVRPLSIRSTWGDIQLLIAAEGVVQCILPRMDDMPEEAFALQECGRDPYSTYIRTLLKGDRPKQVPIGQLRGTEFQKKVWAGLLTIPCGETVSYKAMAERIGCAAAIRAVASACGKNPVPLFIPCHRVIGSDGRLGGFSGGLAWKRMLLDAEQSKRS